MISVLSMTVSLIWTNIWYRHLLNMAHLVPSLFYPTLILDTFGFEATK